MAINNKKRQIERQIQKQLASGVTNVSLLLKELELGSVISPRRTYSVDSMLKAVIFKDLKGLKSYRKLSMYLLNEVDNRRNLGFDDKVPTHQDFSNFIANLENEYKETLDFVIKRIRDLADSYLISLNIERTIKIEKKTACQKTKFNLRREKLDEVASLARKDLNKTFKFDAERKNKTYTNNDIIDVLIAISTDHKFTESGAFKYNYDNSSGAYKAYQRITPCGRTILRALRKYSYDDLRPIFMSVMKRMVQLAKRRGIIDGRKVTVAVDATDIYFYGNHSATPNVVNADHQTHGTGFAFKFVEIAIVTHNQRFALCVIPKLNNGEMHDILTDLIEFAKEQVNVGTVLMDRGFYSLEDMKNVDNAGKEFIIPMKEGTNAFKRLSNYASSDTLIIPNLLDKFTGIAVKKADGTMIYTLTNIKIKPTDYNLAKYIAFFYRHRWQIETNFREIKQNFLGRTKSIRYGLKYFYFIFSNILFNFWILVNVLLELCYGFKGKNGITTYFFSSVLLDSIESVT